MDFISLLNILFIVIYAGILGLVAPYVGVKSEHYGSYVPTALAVTSGSVLWILLTWVGMPHDQVWIWLIVMLGMPASMWFVSNVIAARRSTGNSSQPTKNKKPDSTADDIVILSS